MNTDSQTVRRTRSENAEFVIASIKALGLQPHPQSRLMRMHRVLTKGGGIIPQDDSEFETALEAERDFQVLAFVLEQAATQSADNGFRQLVKNAMRDSVLPQEDRAQSKGRDAQFELFVAAVCQSAGLHPVAREEPDVTCHVDAVKFGIAAKRIKNIRNLEAHVRKAANQIKKAGLPGVIALDTNVALNRDNKRVTTPIADDKFAVLYRQAMQHFMDHFHDRIQKWVRGKGVRGIVVHDQQVRLQLSGEWSLAGMTMWVETARDNQRRKREFAAFRGAYEDGIPNVRKV